MERKGTFKLDFIRQIEKDVQKKWEELKISEVDALDDVKEKSKYFVSFPFPYMNGRLHLGHTFSLSKCEFAVRFERLRGKRCLFPFGFHATGMPIKACADKLKREIEQFGCPPSFVEQSVDVEETVGVVDKSKSKKSKAQAKTGNMKYQWNIMKSFGLDDEEIVKFCDASYWLDYFPPLAISDLKNMGVFVDWRRSFITTDLNPYFDSFVKWQFRHLKNSQKIKYGERYTIYSPRDGQACMDHDRSKGEGVGPQEYTLIKLEIIKPFPRILKKLEKTHSVFLVAATLRPETMYGQTNCWVKPDLDYVCFETTSKEMFVCTKRAALNLSYQNFTVNQGQFDVTVELKGKNLIGLAVTAPFSDYDKVYVLPMESIKPDKGTGVVTCVPSDSPDDYMNLEELKQNKELREKYKLTDGMVLPYTAKPIIEVPGVGDMIAAISCTQFQVQNSKDAKRLEEAKQFSYTKSFSNGILLVGEFKGQKIHAVKKLIKNQLIDLKLAVSYYEPEKEVISRSGEPCVVALCKQWYLDYGEDTWKNVTKSCLDSMNCYHDEVRKNFEGCLDWLHEYACSRRYGLGTKLPWDPDWLIESLSDSTIYMAYYTIAHFLQGGTLKGDANVSKIAPSDLTDDFWDFIFLNGNFPKNSKIPQKLAEKMKKEFQYWYPLDLRVSGKDLIQNHLTFFIYNHTAIWNKNPELWPKAIRANGHLMLNSAKMSKSEGNFLTLSEAIEKYSADAMRLALADAGDSIEDANFVGSVADSGILRLYTFIEWTKEMIELKAKLRQGELNFHDKVFSSEMNIKISETENNYSKMLYKEALRTGFFEMQGVRDRYRDIVGTENMHGDIIFQFIKNQAIILSPICPHVSEYIYRTLLEEKNTIVNAKWPDSSNIDLNVINQSQYLIDSIYSFRSMQKSFITHLKKLKLGEKVGIGHIWVAKSYPEWQRIVIETLLKSYQENGKLPENRDLASAFGKMPELKKYIKRVMPFVQMIKEKTEQNGISALKINSDLDEKTILLDNKNYLLQSLNIQELFVHSTDEDGATDKIKLETSPGNPYITYEQAKEIPLKFINPQPASGFVSKSILISDSVKLSDLHKQLGCGENVKFWRWNDPELGPRMMPSLDITKGKTHVKSDSVIKLSDNKQFLEIHESNGFKFNVGESITYIVNNK